MRPTVSASPGPERIVSDVDLHASHGTPNRARPDVGIRPGVDGDRAGLARRVRLPQRHAEAIAERVEDPISHRRGQHAEPRRDGWTLQEAPAQHVGEVRRRVPVREVGQCHHRERRAVVQRVEEAKRAAQRHRGHQLHQTLARRQWHTADHAVASGHAERVGPCPRTCDEVRRRAVDQAWRSGRTGREDAEAGRSHQRQRGTTRTRRRRFRQQHRKVSARARRRFEVMKRWWQGDLDAGCEAARVGPRRCITGKQHHRGCSGARRQHRRAPLGGQRHGHRPYRRSRIVSVGESCAPRRGEPCDLV